jgi:hypothetical protein
MYCAVRILSSLLLLAPGLAVVGGDPPATPPQTPAGILASLKEEYTKADKKVTKEYEAAKTDAERGQVLEKSRKRARSMAARAVELARKNPKDPVALEALSWVITGGLGYFPETEAAFELVARNHISSDKIDPICGFAALYSHAEAGGAFLRKVLDKSPHRTMRGIACLSLARSTCTRAERARHSKEPQADRLAREAEDLYEQAKDRYGDVTYRDRTIGERAEAALFEMRHLVIGKEAPDIAGEDADGKRFKLSDYRGKVLVLDFWGDW